MELTSAGIALAVFETMGEKNCDEDEAIAHIHEQLSKSVKDLKKLWGSAGRSMIRTWTGDQLRGFGSGGPRPSIPLNYGRNRRKERWADLPWSSCLIRLPDGSITTIGDLTTTDLDTMIQDRKSIADRNLFHAEEWSHIRSLVTEGKTVADCYKRLDERAHQYLIRVARIVETKPA